MCARCGASARFPREAAESFVALAWLTPCTSRGIRFTRPWLTSLLALAVAAGAAGAEPKRDVPDYDGRGNPDADADSWALWVPRIVLAPLYLTNEYLLRRPLGALVTHAERERWAETVVQIFTWGNHNQNLIAPTALYDFGLLPSVGFYYAGDGVFGDGNDLRLHAATWGTKWINATAADRYALDNADRLQVRLEFKRSEDNLFFGIGPAVTDDGKSRYGLERTEGSLGYRRALGGESRFDVEAGVHRIAFIEGSCCDDPSLDSRVAAGEVMAPPGYRSPYTSAFARVELTLDQRRPRPEPGGGSYLHLRGAPSVDLGGGRSWLEYGGEVGHALDLTGHRRTLRMQLALDFVDSISGGPIPFTEYPVAGGERMPGFVPGWLTDRSVAVAQLAYTWPVWLGLDAQTRLSVGNAFGAHLDGFAAGQLRWSGDMGFTTSTAHDQGFEVLIGLGSETFDRGAGVTSVRVTVGSRRGF
jgi:hypothetical protein